MSSGNSLNVSTNSQNITNSTVNLEAGVMCLAITQAGTQFSRKADEGSNYCWQHKSTYEPNEQDVSSYPSNNSRSSTSSGRTIYTGPRGGKNYINVKGNKVYENNE
jgi:hypothetical protein